MTSQLIGRRCTARLSFLAEVGRRKKVLFVARHVILGDLGVFLYEGLVGGDDGLEVGLGQVDVKLDLLLFLPVQDGQVAVRVGRGAAGIRRNGSAIR